MATDEKGQSVALAVPPTTRAQERTQSLERNMLALAQTPEERAAAFQLAAVHRQHEMIREAAVAIAGSSWGANLSVDARAAIARYALETGTDPVRHWLVLGNKLYDTAELWLDLVAAQPDFSHVTHEYINDDERAGPEERARRKALRVQHNTPEDCKGICVVTIHRAGKPPAEGVNWAGHRKCYVAARKAEGIKEDPIGEQEPGKASFTRAFRRAAKHGWPLWFQRHPVGRLSADEAEGIELQALGAGVDRLLEQGREARKAAPETPIIRTEVQPGVRVEAGSGGAVDVPQDAFVVPDTEDARARAEERAALAAEDEAPIGDDALAKAKAELLALLEHPAFSAEDRKVQRRLLEKPTTTAAQVQSWIKSYRGHISAYMARS